MQLLAIVGGAMLCSAYYTVTDCPLNCQSSEQACVVMRVEPGRFTTDCVESLEMCRKSADDTVACVTRDHPTVGGWEVWKEFEKQRPEPIPPTPCPTPDKWHVIACDRWAWAGVVCLCINAMGIFTYMLTGLIRRLLVHRRQFQIETVRRPDNPYQDTTEPLVSD